AWNQTDKVAEGFLNRGEILEDVRMIEFKIVDDRDLGQIVHKFAALIEKCGVVFVAFNDEPLAVRNARALSEVVANASNQETGGQCIVLKGPAQQRSGRGLTVCPCDNERALAANEKFLQQFRQ